jgi:hypothetical protein
MSFHSIFLNYIMPPKQTKTKKKATVVVRVAQSKPVKTKNSNRKIRRRKQIKPKNKYAGISPQLALYAESVAHPFNAPPIRMGFDTFVPSSLHTAYLRNGFTTNSTDGSFDIVIMPNLAGHCFINTAGAGTTPTWTIFAAANASPIISQIDNARVVSMGLRVFPQMALTAAPGIMSSGVSPRCDVTDALAFFALNTLNRQNLPYNQLFLGRTGNTECSEVTWRPTDIQEFIFSNRSISPFALASSAPSTVISAVAVVDGLLDCQGSFIHISGQNMPPSTPIFFESIMHIECTDSRNLISSDTADDSNPCVANDTNVPDMQSAYRRIVNMLPDPSSALDALSIMAGSQIGKAAIRYAKQKTIDYQNSLEGFVRIE